MDFSFFCLLSLVLSLGTTELSHSILITPPIRHLYILMRYPLIPLNTRKNRLSQPLLTCQTFLSLCSPSLDLLQYVHVSLVLGSPELYPALQTCLTSAEQKGRINSLHLLMTLFLMRPRISLAFATRTHCWFMFTLLWSQEPFLQSCFPNSHSPVCNGTCGYSSPGGDLYISLLLSFF